MQCLLCFYCRFYINIHKYANKIIYKSDHRKKDMCLSFNLTPILVCSRISRTLDMIEFVGLPPNLENHKRGCHGNHAFSRSPYQISFEENLFHILRVPLNNLA